MPGDFGDDHRVTRDRAVANAGVAVVRVDEVPVEVDHRREIQVDSECRQRASLCEAVIVRCPLARVFVGELRDHRRDRRLARQRRRQARDGAALLVGRDPQRRHVLASTLILPPVNLAADRTGRKSLDVASADEHATQGPALDEPIDLGWIAITDDEMPAEFLQLHGVGGQHARPRQAKPGFQRQRGCQPNNGRHDHPDAQGTACPAERLRAQCPRIERNQQQGQHDQRCQRRQPHTGQQRRAPVECKWQQGDRDDKA